MATKTVSRLRLPKRGEDGIAFDQLVYQRMREVTGGSDQAARAADVVLAYIQGYDTISDELTRAEGASVHIEPTPEQYAERYSLSRVTAYRRQALFRTAFDPEQTPRNIVDLLWKGVEREQEKRPGDDFIRWLSIRVVEVDE